MRSGHVPPPARWAPLLACVLGLLGCRDLRDYPGDWARPVASGPGDCSGLSGSYADTDSDGSIVGLLYLLTQSSGDGGPSTHADRVNVDAPAPDSLSIVGYRGDAVVGRRQYSVSAGSLECGPGGAVLIPARGLLAGQGVVGYEKVTLALSRDADGYLIVKSEVTGFGAYGPIPLGGRSRIWSRFQPYVLEQQGVRRVWFVLSYAPHERPGTLHPRERVHRDSRDTWEKEAVEHLAFDCAHGLWRIEARSVLYSDMYAVTEPAANYPAPWQPPAPGNDESDAMRVICATALP